MLREFREFAMRGNVMDLAVAVIIGAAFNRIVTSLVDDILMPLIGIFTGGVDFSEQGFYISDVFIRSGAFVQAVIDFLLVAFVIFLLIRWIKRFKQEEPKPEEGPITKDCPYCFTTIPIKATRCPNCTSEL